MIKNMFAPIKWLKYATKYLTFEYKSIDIRKSPLVFTNKMYFCSEHKQSNHTLSRQEKVKLFQQLMKQGTQQSLTKAAEMFVQVEELNELQQKQLKQLHEYSTIFPHNLHHLIEIQVKLLQNIKLQLQDNHLIEKRALKQIQDTSKFGIIKIGKEVIEVADSLKKCQKLASEIYQNQNKQLMTEVNLCQSLLDQIFQKYGIEQFDPTNEVYDPNTQEALFQVPSPDQSKKNIVAVTTRTGYKIKGRLLRSAHVGVFS